MTRLRPFKIALLVACICLLASPPWGRAAHATVVADLDQKQVSITTDFNGAELLLFGALQLMDGDDIAIEVRGPAQPIAVRRKDKVAGIWLNTESATLINIPSFYHILSTRPIAAITDAEERGRISLGYEHLPFTTAPGSRIDEGGIDEWQEALVRNMEANLLWGISHGTVHIRQNALFRTDVILPANIIPGEYRVRIIHFRNGVMIHEDISSLQVAKRGLSAEIFRIAHDYPPFYGIFAIVFAVSAGWLAAAAFRR